MRPLAEVQREILGSVSPLPDLEVATSEALGLALAAHLPAPHDVPPFTNSAMDGYAVVASDLAEAPTRLEVIEEVAAGHVARSTVVSGTAIKIMTGAPVPSGADTVVRVEDTAMEGSLVTVNVSPEPGENVRPAGGDLARGEVVFPAGTRLTPHHLGVLTSLGVASPLVHRRPRVAVLSTGDEVMSTGERLGPGKIHDSNRPQLISLLEELGAEVIDLGIVPDSPSELQSALAAGAERSDVLLSSGGVSMGEHDVVKEVLAATGDVSVWQVAIKPAKPLAFGWVHDKPFFGLPGNPVSVVVSFELFARPALLKMMGASHVFRPRVGGVLGADVGTDPAKQVYLRMIVDYRTWTAHPAGGQASNQLTALARSNAFGVVPVGVAELTAGSAIELEMFRWPETRSEEEVLGG